MKRPQNLLETHRETNLDVITIFYEGKGKDKWFEKWSVGMTELITEMTKLT